MPKIIIQAQPDQDADGHVTLSERLVTGSLESPHYARQLLERVAWAIADAEAIESHRARPAFVRQLQPIGL